MITTLNLDKDFLKSVRAQWNQRKNPVTARRAQSSYRQGERPSPVQARWYISQAQKHFPTMMVLVDTSVWIDFLRRGNSSLTELLEQGRVCTHQIILGELACGNISGRANFLSLLYDLPACDASTHEEVLSFIEEHKAFGKGVGFFDLHLLCSALISSAPLWTLDGKLKKLSKKVGSHYSN